MRKALVPEEVPAHESSASTSPAISLTSDDESEEEAWILWPRECSRSPLTDPNGPTSIYMPSQVLCHHWYPLGVQKEEMLVIIQIPTGYHSRSLACEAKLTHSIVGAPMHLEGMDVAPRDW